MHLIDITRDITTAEVYPGDPPTVVRQIKTIGEESDYNLSVLCACVHAGTHVDAPLHFLNGGKSIDQVDLDCFVGYAYLASHEGLLLASDAKRILETAKKLEKPASQWGGLFLAISLS